MGVEGRRLEHFGKGKLHLVGKCGEMRGRYLPMRVLDEVQVLDQEVAAARAVVEERCDLVRRIRIDLAALRHWARAAPSLTGMLEMPDFVDVSVSVLLFLAHRASAAAAAGRLLADSLPGRGDHA